MKYSILGANGFLSDAVARHCRRAGHELTVYGLEEPKNVEFDKFVSLNLAEEELKVADLLDSDIIIYAIGAGIQSNLQEGNELIYNLNVSAPVSICNQLRKAKYEGTFITFGSYFEMGETTLRRPFSEEEVMLSTSPAPNDYTVSKRMLSRFVSSYRPTFRHCHFYLPTIYGAGENPLRLIPYTIRAIRKDEPLHFTSGEQVRQYIHVSEVAQIIEAANACALPTGIYNVEGKETLSVKKLVQLIHDHFGKQPSAQCFGSAERADTGMKYLALDGRKLTQLTGFHPTISVEEMLDSYVE